MAGSGEEAGKRRVRGGDLGQGFSRDKEGVELVWGLWGRGWNGGRAGVELGQGWRCGGVLKHPPPTGIVGAYGSGPFLLFF